VAADRGRLPRSQARSTAVATWSTESANWGTARAECWHVLIRMNSLSIQWKCD
jgi:hypothetical protein